MEFHISKVRGPGVSQDGAGWARGGGEAAGQGKFRSTAQLERAKDERGGRGLGDSRCPLVLGQSQGCRIQCCSRQKGRPPGLRCRKTSCSVLEAGKVESKHPLHR